MKGAAEFRLPSSAEQSTQLPPLVVDLDGTLVKTDLLVESLLVLLKQKPYCVLQMPVWLLRGKAYFKQQISKRITLDVAALPYRDDLLTYLRAQRAAGRSIVLATAGDVRIARQVAAHWDLFDLVLASDGTTNLSGESKRDRLVDEFGEKGFDYAANHRKDLVVWASARKAIVVGPGPGVSSSVASVAEIDRTFEDRRKTFSDYLGALRPHHWLKNLLVLVPLLAAHRFEEIPLLGYALLAFVAFCCFASAGYLMNDLLDLPADRRHPSKRYRPFASGDLPPSYALGMIPVLVGFGCLVGALISPVFLGFTLLYFGLNITYSLYVRKIVLLDVILLAGLYTLRVIAGSAAVAIWPSHWLLAFSMFLFFSLALAKRYGELVIMRRIDGDGAKARGYVLGDGELLSAMGIASGYLSVLVLALYISSSTARALYGRYELLWFLCPLMLYWISHIWLIAHRGRMPDDPLVFATGDRVSRILMLLMLAISLLAL
jgi:4-hydroxybenzoate polyprenyltransferase